MLSTILLLGVAVKAQVKVGSNPTTINPSAVFEVESTNKGVLLPRLTSAERLAIANPANGLLIYNSSKNCIEWYNGTSWFNPCGIADGVPGTPTSIIATAGDAQASIAFTPGASELPITSYTVTSSPGGITATGGSSPIVVTGITNGTAYTFTVTATSTAGTSAASSPSNSVTPQPPAAPAAPADVVATASDAQASISFTAPTSELPITGYTVTSSPGGITGTGTSSPISVTGLTNGTAYTFTVTATSAAGSSVASAPSNSVTPQGPQPPQAPSNVIATAGNAQASIAFTAPTSELAITGYTVTSSPGGFTGTGSASPISVSGLTNGTSYTFTVIATSAAGSSVASTASNSVTPVGPPSAPSKITPLLGNAQVTLSWTAPQEAVDSYSIDYKLVTASTWTTTTSSTTSKVIDGLTNGSSYDFRVKAVNQGGESAFSEKVISTPMNATVLLHDNFNQDYTASNWYETDTYIDGVINPSSGVISRDATNGRLKIDPSLNPSSDGNEFKSFLKTNLTFDRLTDNIEIQYDVIHSVCPNASNGTWSSVGYGNAAMNINTNEYLRVYQYDFDTYAALGTNFSYYIGQYNEDYQCEIGKPLNIRIVLKKTGGTNIYFNGVLKLQMGNPPNTFNNKPFFFQASGWNYQPSVSYDNVTIIKY